MVNSTLEDLLLYLHKDLSEFRKAEIEQELQQNWSLREKFNVLRESFERLNNIKLLSPRQQTINAIMKYAGTAKVS